MSRPKNQPVAGANLKSLHRQSISGESKIRIFESGRKLIAIEALKSIDSFLSSFGWSPSCHSNRHLQRQNSATLREFLRPCGFEHSRIGSGRIYGKPRVCCTLSLQPTLCSTTHAAAWRLRRMAGPPSCTGAPTRRKAIAQLKMIGPFESWAHTRDPGHKEQAAAKAHD